MALRTIYDAPTAWKYLNGIINVYKPPGKKVEHVRTALFYNLCKDLNAMDTRETRQLPLIGPGGPNKCVTEKIADLSDDVLAVGPRYQMIDFKCLQSANLGKHTSGVLLFGLNNGIRTAFKIHESRPIRVYHVSGKFGSSTETNFFDSRITSRATFKHIRTDRFSALISSLQASNQRKMYEMCGIDIQSQAGYELACRGLIRPVERQQPVVYGMKLINFKSPEFTLEIHAINETEMFLAALINDIGIELRSTAHCTGIRCIRHGLFNINDSLLRNSWNLQDVFDNMKLCKEILKRNPDLLKQKNAQLVTKSQETVKHIIDETLGSA